MQRLILLFFFLCLVSCASQSPLPTDHYYRLPELKEVNTGEKLVDVVSVIQFQADGLYHERAILYRENEIELKQYHYHHWADSPTSLLQERLSDRLRLSHLASTVLTSYEGNSELIIKGQIKAFEWLQEKDNERVYVKLMFQVNSSSGNLPILHKEYLKTIPLPANTIFNAINAFAEAVDLIFSDFYTDLVELIQA